MPLPDLVAVQRDSFNWFLEEGIAETLTDISPIEDFTGSLKLELADPEFEPPKYSEEECKEKDMTFSRPLFVTAVGLDPEKSRLLHGKFRLPTLLKRVDRLARGIS